MLTVGDCREVLAGWEPDSIAACVTDPPYEIAFMGRAWDRQGVAFDPATWAEVLRVLKPGAHMLAFGGTRTYHRMVCAIEDAGFEVRDCITWMYATGFPKSLDVSKALDRSAGAERSGEVREWRGGARRAGILGENLGTQSRQIFEQPATPEAAQWEGFGTALKPAVELIALCRKPLSEPTIAANVLKHGTGALNIAAGRIGHEEHCRMMPPQQNGLHNPKLHQGGRHAPTLELKPSGRWPANTLFSHHPDCNGSCHPSCPVALLDAQAGERTSGGPRGGQSGKVYGGDSSNAIYGGGWGYQLGATIGDSGPVSRFFACFQPEESDYPPFIFEAKPSRAERDAGTDRNGHTTVKPVNLLRYLLRLVVPPGGTVLDPFLGSGTTAVAAALEGVACLGIEQDSEYVEIAAARIAHARRQADRARPLLEKTRRPERNEAQPAFSFTDH